MMIRYKFWEQGWTKQDDVNTEDCIGYNWEKGFKRNKERNKEEREKKLIFFIYPKELMTMYTC